MASLSRAGLPGIAALTTQTLPSGFAWSVARKTKPDFELPRNALEQQGPWAGRRVAVSPDWFLAHLAAVIDRIDWQEARTDVQRFLPMNEQAGLDAWGKDFFAYQLEQLKLFL